ncbi:hypothetical protein F5B20DRAFT_528357 [Whalleya microplaca]|nr:hypothetical protein F5B20DRAFT_528357 [Whalleya microplaca]
MEGDPIVPAPPPWKLRGAVYMVSFWSEAGNLPDYAYSPLEGSSLNAHSDSGRHLGGLSQIQIIRYSESPVGPYDELIICPGFFAYEVEENGRRETEKNARITRIYVSQKQTCWNGRKNWSIPKHLARFEWNNALDGSTQVKVYPHDATSDPFEMQPSEKPFLQTAFRPLRWAPAFPLSLSWLKYIGIDSSLVQPPLPEGHGSQNELPGTDRWCKIAPLQSTRRALLGWADLTQRDEEGNLITSARQENFWPGLGRWHLAIKLEDANVEFGEGVHWDPPTTKL